MMFWKKQQTFLPGILLIFVIAAFHMQMTWDGDDLWYMGRNRSFDWLAYRYAHWSSRLLIDTAILLFVKTFGLMAWRIVDTCVAWLCCRLLVYFACPSEHQGFGMWCMLGSLFLFPLSILHTAGWGATMINYLWPGTALLVALLPLRRYAIGRSIPPWLVAISLLALAFALDAEQAWLIFLMLWILFIAICKERSIRRLLLVQGIMVMVAAACIFLCPGNAFRYEIAVYGCWPDFATVSLLDKGVLAFCNMGVFFLVQDRLLILLTLALAFVIWKVRHDAFLRVVGFLPLVCKIGVMIWGRGWGQQQIVTPLTFDQIAAYVPLVVSVLFFVSLALGIWILFGQGCQAACLLWLFLAGCASSLSLALSPTLFASAGRIFFFQYLVFFIILLRILNVWHLLHLWPICDKMEHEVH